VAVRGRPSTIAPIDWLKARPCEQNILATKVARQAAISQVRIDVGARMRSVWR